MMFSKGSLWGKELKLHAPCIYISGEFSEFSFQKAIIHIPQPFSSLSINEARIMISVFDRVENIVGNGENAGYQHFLLFQQCFQTPILSGSINLGIVW